MSTTLSSRAKRSSGPLPQAVGLAVLLGLVMSAAPSSVCAQEREGDGFLRPLSRTGRFGVGVGQSRRIVEKADGTVTEEIGVVGSLLVGVGLAVHRRVAVDLDGGMTFDLTPQVELSQLTLAPGVRLFALPELYGRISALGFLLEPRNTLGLVGAGYYITARRLAAFIELNVVVWSWKEVETVLVPRFGLEAAF